MVAILVAGKGAKKLSVSSWELTRMSLTSIIMIPNLISSMWTLAIGERVTRWLVDWPKNFGHLRTMLGCVFEQFQTVFFVGLLWCFGWKSDALIGWLNGTFWSFSDYCGVLGLTHDSFCPVQLLKPSMSPNWSSPRSGCSTRPLATTCSSNASSIRSRPRTPCRISAGRVPRGDAIGRSTQQSDRFVFAARFCNFF